MANLTILEAFNQSLSATKKYVDNRINGLASETYVNNKIAEASLSGGEVDLSGYVTKETGNASQITFADGQTFQTKLDNGTLKGEKGDKGDTGAKGEDGLTTQVRVNGTTYTQVDGVITLPNYSASVGESSHTHSNKDILDTITADNVHTHSNKSVIDAITSDMTTNWNKSIPFENTYVSDCDTWLTNGYTKTSTETTNHPSVCTGADKWGVLFYISEDANNRTGTQMYFPVDGTYAGRIFTRRMLQGEPGAWNLVSTFDGNYDSLTNKPTIPTTTSQLTNDSNYVTTTEMTDAINNASLGGSSEAKDITITDVGGYYEATNVEGALQEAGSQIKESIKYETILPDPNADNQGIQVNSPNNYDIDYIHKHIDVPGFALLLNYNMTNSERVRIANNKIVSEYGDAIELNNPTTETDINKSLKDVIISNNFLETKGTDENHSAGFALGIAGTKNVAVTGNIVPYSRQEGLHIEDTQENITVVGNVFANNYYKGTWLEDRNRENGQYAKVPIINSNHFTQHENAKRDVGLYTVNNQFGNIKYVNFRNNRLEGFRTGICPDGYSQPDVDGCIIENCEVAIEAIGKVWGDVSVKGNTKTLVHFHDGGSIEGTVKSLDVYNHDEIFTFEDNCQYASLRGFSCSLPYVYKIEPVDNIYSSIKICKAPTYMKGVVEVNCSTNTVNGYFYRKFEIEMDSTGYSKVTDLNSNVMGTIGEGILTIENGYLVLNFYHSTMYELHPDIVFKGLMVWGNNEVVFNKVYENSLNDYGILYLWEDDCTIKVPNPTNGMQIRVPLLQDGIKREMNIYINNTSDSDIYYYLMDREGNELNNLCYPADFTRTIKSNSKYLLSLIYINDMWFAKCSSTAKEVHYETVCLTQSEYDAITTKNPNTIYLITG